MTYSAAEHAFAAASAEFDQLIAHLQTMRGDHFGATEHKLHWGDVGSVNHANDLLRECVRFLSGAEG